MKHKEVNQKRSNLPLWACVLFQFLIASVMGIISLYFGAGSEKLKLLAFLLSNPLLVLLNLFPLILFAFLFWWLTNRPWIGTLVSGILCLVYSWAEYWKLMARGECIYAEDLLVIREAVKMSGRYITVTWQIILSLILVICAVVFMAIMFWHTRIHNKRIRFAMCAAGVFAGILSYVTVYTSDSLYQSFAVYPGYNEWIENDRYLSTGSFYPFLHSVKTAIPEKPEGYQQNTAEEILTGYEDSDIPDNSKVSVICVQLEAMADFSKYTNVITENDPYALYHQLEGESYSGELATNIFAGGTVDTERSVVTGFWKLGSFQVKSWSYARYFQSQGYTLNGAHAGEQNFYDRKTVNENLGFDNYRYIENYYNDKVGGIPWDNTFFADITDVCLQDMESGPVFSFNVTYQNHGPYSTDECYFETEYVPQSAVDTQTWYMLNNYLYGVDDTWQNVMAMVNTFRQCDQPVVIVLFGDHKPWMGDQNCGYEALGIDLSLQTTESYYNYYTTDYIIWANQAAKDVTGNSFTGTGPTVSSCYLMNLVFQQCGWDGPAFMKLTDEMMNLLPVTSSNDWFMYQNEIVPEDALDTDTCSKLLDMDFVRYYLEYDYMQGND